MSSLRDYRLEIRANLAAEEIRRETSVGEVALRRRKKCQKIPAFSVTNA